MYSAEPVPLSDRVIIALDFPDTRKARQIVEQIGDVGTFYKIGHQLAFAGGLELARELKSAGKRVFLDMKLLDIDNTIRGGVTSIASLGMDMLTLHAYPKAMRAAVAAKADAQADGLTLLGVSVLTSMDDADLSEAGYAETAQDLVLRRAGQAVDAGMDGLVCSAHEVQALRAAIGADLKLVVPGIRPAGSEHGDQKRVMTPGDALKAGADHLVIGRPIAQAGDPEKAMRAVLDEIASV